MSKIKDIKLSKNGSLQIEWAETHMPVLMQIRDRFLKNKPFKNFRIACCLHITKETGVLMKTLRAGGATVALAGSNPLSTQDDIAAALVKEGVEVFAWRGIGKAQYYQCINKVLDTKPNLTMDDGGDLVSVLHSKRQNLIKNVVGGTEETTTGVIRFRAMERDKVLQYPIVAVKMMLKPNIYLTIGTVLASLQLMEF